MVAEATGAPFWHASQHAPGGTDELFWIGQEFPDNAVDSLGLDFSLTSIGVGNGNICATMFKPHEAMTVSKVTTMAGAAGATTQTLSRAGLARVDGYSASLTEKSWLSNPAVLVTPLAETLSNLNLWQTGGTLYSNNAFSTARGLAASVLLDPATWYAFLSIQLAATAGQMRGITGPPATAFGSLPLRTATLTGQTDLPIVQFTLTSLQSARGWARFHS